MRERWFYILIILYIGAAFSWWSYTLIDTNAEIYKLRQQVLDHDRSDLKLGLDTLVGLHLKENEEPNLLYNKTLCHTDTAVVMAYMRTNFPHFASLVAHADNKLVIDTNYDFGLLEALKAKKNRRFWMFLSEGIVFAILLMLIFSRLLTVYRERWLLNQRQNNFLLSVTHELKSPIASIKLGLETLVKRELSPNQYKDLSSNALDDLNRLNLLIDKILIANRLDTSKAHLKFEQVNLTDICNNIAEKCVVNNVKNQQFTFEIDHDIYIPGDEFLLQVMVNNLIENAVKYTPHNGDVSLKLQHKGNKVLLRVKDNGIGIDDENKQMIFEKFYRTGNEDTRQTQGTGLGLYIVGNIAKQHNFTMFLDAQMGKGSLFEVQIPYNK